MPTHQSTNRPDSGQNLRTRDKKSIATVWQVYVLARQLYAAVGKTGIHTRIVGLDRDTNKELILTHIQKNKGTQFKELQQVLPSLSRGEIQVLMRELKGQGKIYVEGKGAGARWFAE